MAIACGIDALLRSELIDFLSGVLAESQVRNGIRLILETKFRKKKKKIMNFAQT